MPHRLRPPAVRHMDCRIPQTCIARREPHYSSTAIPSAQRSASNTEAYRQKSTTQYIQQRRTPSVPNGVGARGRAFGLRNSEIAFPRTYRIENATGIARHTAKSLIKKTTHIK